MFVSQCIREGIGKWAMDRGLEKGKKVEVVKQSAVEASQRALEKEKARRVRSGTREGGDKGTRRRADKQDKLGNEGASKERASKEHKKLAEHARSKQAHAEQAHAEHTGHARMSTHHTYATHTLRTHCRLHTRCTHAAHTPHTRCTHRKHHTRHPHRPRRTRRKHCYSRLGLPFVHMSAPLLT